MVFVLQIIKIFIIGIIMTILTITTILSILTITNNYVEVKFLWPISVVSIGTNPTFKVKLK